MDALCQLIESYTSTGATPVTDALAVSGIGLAAGALPRAYRGGDPASREEMALAAYLSGVTLTSAGLGAVHGFAAPIGANFPVPHGVVCAALLPHVIHANLKAIREAGDVTGIRRYAAIGRLMTPGCSPDDDEAADACASVCASMSKSLNIPPLGQYGMTEGAISEMVALAKKASSMRFNPVTLSDDALARALRAAIGGDEAGGR
jgi:alcohol dehydrogenase class IV